MKTVILAIGFMLVAVLSFLFYKKVYIPIFGRLNTGKKTLAPRQPFYKMQKGLHRGEYSQNVDAPSAQDAIGLADIVGPYNIMETGDIISIVNVECKNTSLYTTGEEVREARKIARVFAGIRGEFSVIYQQRIVDNSKDIEDLQKTLEQVLQQLRDITQLELSPNPKIRAEAIKHEKQTLLKRREILQDKTKASQTNVMASGKQYQTTTSICLKTKAGQDAQRKSLEKARQVIRLCTENGYQANLLNDLGCIDVNRAYFYEAASFEENINPAAEIPIPVFRADAIKGQGNV